MSTDNTELNIGDDVRWLGNPFTIVDIKGNQALLKQRFSIGICLKGLVPLSELSLEI